MCVSVFISLMRRKAPWGGGGGFLPLVGAWVAPGTPSSLERGGWGEGGKKREGWRIVSAVLPLDFGGAKENASEVTIKRDLGVDYYKRDHGRALSQRWLGLFLAREGGKEGGREGAPLSNRTPRQGLKLWACAGGLVLLASTRPTNECRSGIGV